MAAQMLLQHSDRLPELNLSNLLEPRPEPIAGVASVIDGDTIEIHGQRIRFNGIDAPESRQYCDDAKGFEYPCGRRSAEALDSFLAASRPVRCTFVDWDRYHRFVGDCRRADGASVAAWMVEHGQALDLASLQPWRLHGAAGERRGGKGRSVGRNVSGALEWRAEHADAPSRQPLGIVSRKLVAQSGYSCEPRRTCKQIGSCDEAQWYLQNCPWGGKLDRDGDGVACETLC
ncbi:excalibur calcium-binding domain-containing protein [Mesorhizobium sp. SARCC-RB16n]|uniref:excalibur calcium-binding domain-containing protein n=1 Tax=Mesorhizobium sp. SARCC-RB16n TaxID=2116687 RepID=UPI00166C225C|nr:excalibur calcium-binding domain-containing protein [Mesorhizobium sp. SARCC-RB16n]